MSTRRQNAYQFEGDQLPQWIEAVRADDLLNLHTFVNGLERDLAAVTAGPAASDRGACA
ncbi:hypothetical protein M4D73_20095 [Streptomyces pseudogriseolus]|uniref:hypothetical protein n=1 Tax=Streptomyces pseudogriseolus TaxID=36817 RepID=UPI003492A250|nr:hypothetical protein [Streptomyces pseudogriseolus]